MSFILNDPFYQPANLMLAQGIITWLCYYFNCQYFIGISLGALLYVTHVLTLFNVPLSQAEYVLLASSGIFLAMHRLPWIQFIQSILVYKPQIIAGSCFSALLITKSYEIIPTLSPVDLSICAIGLIIMVVCHYAKSHLGPLLATCLLILLFSHFKLVNLNELTSFKWPTYETDWVTVSRCAIYLSILAMIDIATCLSVLEKIGGFSIQKYLTNIQKTHALTSIVGSLGAISLTAVYYENMVNDTSESEHNATLPYNALCYFLMALLLLFVSLRPEPFAFCFSLYLAFLVIINIFETENLLLLFLPLLPLCLLSYFDLGYLMTLSITSISLNTVGLIKQDITRKTLAKTMIFWCFLLTTVFLFKLF